MNRSQSIVVFAGIVFLFTLVTLSAFVRVTTVYPGSVGIRVPLYGLAKDKQEYDLVRGRVWYNPFYENIYVFQTFMQQVVWSASEDDGSSLDESITFQSSEGKSVNCDVAFAYSIDEKKIPEVFRELRQTPEEITHGYLRSKVRDAFVLSGHSMQISDLLGSRVGDLLASVKRHLDEELGPKGFKFDMVSIVGKMRVDDEVERAIAATITAQQKAIEAQNKVKQSEAEAKQAVAVAQGKSDAEVAEASGKAEARLKIAQAEAQANHLLTQSLTPELISYQSVQRWDGKLPYYFGGSGPVPFLSAEPQPTQPVKVGKK